MSLFAEINFILSFMQVIINASTQSFKFEIMKVQIYANIKKCKYESLYASMKIAKLNI